jgi:hypothetical protein
MSASRSIALMCCTMLAIATSDDVATSLIASPRMVSPFAAAKPSHETPAPSLVDSTRYFTFHSGLWLNLHHFLYVQARARRGEADRLREAVVAAPRDTVGMGALPEADRREWEQALQYYEEHIANRDIGFDSALVETNYRLSALGDDALSRDTTIDAGIARALARAEPAYRAVWWPRHDRANREWIAILGPMVREVGDAMVRQIADAFRETWATTPDRVEVVAYANWAGAYTSVQPTLITISSLNTLRHSTDAFELLFHEAGHAEMSTFDREWRQAAAEQGRRVSRDLSHAVLFYTVGEAARRILSGHIPYAESHGVWMRGDWPGYRVRVIRDWQPWLDKKISFERAIARLVANG